MLDLVASTLVQIPQRTRNASQSARRAALRRSVIVYPMAGLAGMSAAHSSGTVRACLFLAGLCLCNLMGATAVNLFGIVCSSPSVATLLSVSFALVSMLFCGFLVNIPAISQRGAGKLRYLSSLFYLNEIVISDEMIGATVRTGAQSASTHAHRMMCAHRQDMCPSQVYP